ncbi:transcriptional regulator [Aurantiacibacter atlanticus]|uniref:Transcriptional regulator n=1 Tax=Aurantiacibacter atlanticus TaxID=1648404 RepID=A0A0H4VDB6_9SPHN|nr:ATP-binding protein [Aurantiacibacter atlanticus]AKQ40851.1 transcriptional regulator [Aurantiacibacter atlanticus]
MEENQGVTSAVVTKTVAAFANSYEGGTLLIGVSDDGEALGLEQDYVALGDADKDRFELHLRNLFSEALGQNVTASKLKISFPEIEGVEICKIDVRPADAAVVLTVADKNGLKSEKLYVRSGNSSPEMPMSEVQAFLNKRFAAKSVG